MADQNWIIEAKKCVGIQEVKDQLTIKGWAKTMGPKWYSDQVDPTKSDGFGPWCGLFVAHCMYVAKIALPDNYFRASSWLSWGQKLDKPVAGCVVTFTRNGGGHVGFVLGVTANGKLVVIGGNQGNKVCIEIFDPAKATGYRYPSNVVVPTGAIQVVSIKAPETKTQA